MSEIDWYIIRNQTTLARAVKAAEIWADRQGRDRCDHRQSKSP